MAKSILQYTGTGSLNQWALNFTLGYTNRSDISVTVDAVEVEFTFITDALIEISSGPPAQGAVIEITRTVSDEVLQNTYTDGPAITGANLNGSFTQLIHLVHQVLDGRFRSPGALRTVSDSVSSPVTTWSLTEFPYDTIPLDNTNQDIRLILPDVSRVEDGTRFDVMSLSNLNRATIEVEVAGQMRSVNGYSSHSVLADLVYLGLSQETEVRSRVAIEVSNGRWNVVGLFRSNPDDDLAFDQTGTGGDGSGSNDRADHFGTQPISTIVDLATQLAGKAPLDHTHTLGEVVDAGSAASRAIGTGSGQVAILDADGEFPASVLGKAPGTQTAAEIKASYESNEDTNAFTDAAVFKLTTIESNATDDQTDAEIKTAYENNADTNAFTDAAVFKLSTIESNATDDQTGPEIETLYNAEVPAVSGAEITAGTETAVRRYTPADIVSFIGTHGAEGDAPLTDAEIKTAYENNADTNAFTDAAVFKLTTIESNATDDQTSAEIEALYNTEVPLATQVEAEAGTETAVRRWSPERIEQAITALGGGSGNVEFFDEGVSQGTVAKLDVVGTGGSLSVTGDTATLSVSASAGSGLYSSWEVIEPGLPAATFASELASKIATARTNGTGVFLRAGNHDGSTASSIALSGDTVPIRGESMSKTVVEIGGTDKGLDATLFTVTGNVDIAELTFVNGAQIMNVPSSLDAKINDIRIHKVTGINAGAIIRYDTQSPQANAAFGKIVISECEAYNVNHGFYFLTGSSTGVAQVDEFRALRNIVDGFAGTAIGCLATDPIAANAYPASYHGTAHVYENKILNGVGTDASLVVAYGISTTSARHTHIHDNFLYNLNKGALQRMKAIYAKSETYDIINNHLIDAGDDDTTGGGSITAKGDDQGTVTQGCRVMGNRLETTQDFFASSVPNLSGIWVQAANAQIKNNTLKGHWGGGHISTQSVTEHKDLIIEGNTFEVLESNSFGDGVINVVGFFDNMTIKDNRIFNNVGTSDAIVVYTGQDAARTVDKGTITGNQAWNLSGSATKFIKVTKRNGATVTDMIIQGNISRDYGTVISLEGTSIADGTMRIIGNVADGQSTNISANGSTIEEKFNSWQ